MNYETVLRDLKPPTLSFGGRPDLPSPKGANFFEDVQLKLLVD